MSVNFSDFQTDNVGDYLEVFNGHDIAQPLLTTFKVNSGFGTVTSSAGDGSLTFRFISDANYPATGWKGSISLSAKPTVISQAGTYHAVSYTHLRAHETVLDIVCRLLLATKQQHTEHTDQCVTLSH